MELIGRIDEERRFLVELEDGDEDLCLLFTTLEDDEGDPEEYDLAKLATGPVLVVCESFDGEDAWGVTEVVARTDDEAGADDETDDYEDEADNEVDEDA